MTMNVLGILCTGVVAALHLYFAYLEIFVWTRPKGLKIFGLTAAQAQQTANLAANQGIYNALLAVGLVVGLVLGKPDGNVLTVFLLSFIVLVGVYGALTVSRKIALVQALPATVALAFYLFPALHL